MVDRETKYKNGQINKIIMSLEESLRSYIIKLEQGEIYQDKIHNTGKRKLINYTL